MKVSVITPIYNRASFLPSLFESLNHQTSKEFEWIIVDDGSRDDVRGVVNSFVHKGFEVRLYQKVLTLILDSDDELPEDAIAKILDEYQSIKGKRDFAGVCGYMAHRDGQVIGQPLIEIDASEIELRYKYHVCGDMCEVFRTDVLRKFPFPELKGERFCPECLVWNRIARKYRLHVFPKVVYLRDYLDGGLTDNIVKIRMNSPVASMMTYAEMLDLDIPWSQKVKAAINYYRFKACLTAEHVREVNCSIPTVPATWILMKPLGWLMHWKDSKKM